MTKEQAIKQMVERDFSPIPTEWVGIIAEHLGEYLSLPMWGTMFIVDDWYYRTLKTRRMYGDKSELADDLEAGDYDAETREKIEKAIKDDDYDVLGDYIDEEMSGADCILDKDGNTTRAFMYELDGQYLVGINGAGWDFYSGIWDRIYDAMGLKWHDEESEK